MNTVQLTDVQETKLDAIVDALNAQAKRATEYATENEDSIYAEYILGYVNERDYDAIIRRAIDELTANDETELATLLAVRPKTAETLQLLIDSSDAEHTSGIRRRDMEIDSVTIGEIEQEIDSETVDAMAELTDAERDYVKRRADAYIEDSYMYIDLNYDRWSLILDPDRLADNLAD